jgi:hypothetical protein
MLHNLLTETTVSLAIVKTGLVYPLHAEAETVKK